MKLLRFLFFSSLLLGTISGLSIAPGVTIYVHDLVLVLFLAAASLVLVKKHKHAQPMLLLPIAGFIGVALISLLFNAFRFTPPQLTQSALYLVRWVAYAAIYVVIVQNVVPAGIILQGLFMTGTGLGVLGLLQYVFFPSLRPLEYLGWDPHYFRLFSTLLDPNFAGIMLVLSIFLGMYLFAHRSKLMLCCLGLLLIALYLTYSRSSYLAFAVGCVFLAMRSIQWKAQGIVVILLFLLFVVALPKPGGDTLRLDRMASTVARIENWQESIRKIGESPILGFGFNTLRFIPPREGEVDMHSKAAAGVDNSFLFILLTTGIVGLVAYGWLMVRQIRMVGMIGEKQKTLQSLFFASIIAVLVHSMFVNSLFYPWVMIWLWALTGAVESLSKVQR